MDTSTPERRTLKDPVRLLAELQLLVGEVGIGLYLVGLVPFPSLLGGICMLLLAWVCVTQAERPEWRKQGAPLNAISVVLFVFAMVVSVVW